MYCAACAQEEHCNKCSCCNTVDVYSVTVKSGETVVNTTTIPVGHWQEIAYWLDGCGYIDPEYVIEVRVVEESA